MDDNILSEADRIKTVGRDRSCDIVLDEDSVSACHARISLEEDGRVNVTDAGSADGTFLHRNDRWIRIKRVTLCSGDRISFGEIPVPLGRITAVFGDQSNVRLEKQQLVLGHRNLTGSALGHHLEAGSGLQRPRRNPLTGKIEEDRSTNWSDKHHKKGDQQQ